MIKISKPNTQIKAKHAFVTREEPVLSQVCERYGRNPDTLCLKVFYGNPLKEGETLEDALWGDNHDPTDSNQVRKNTKLLIGSQIHNICWKHDLAPRVYAVFEAMYDGKRVAVQLTDYLNTGHYSKLEDVENIFKKVDELGKKYKFGVVKSLCNIRDAIGGKAVDLQPYAYKKGHKEKIKEIYINRGKYGKVYYQDVPELGLSGGPRKTEDRIDYMKLDKIDFRDKVVWDIGCAGGAFCRYAADRGAKRVIGFDTPETADASFYLSNYLNYFNIDFVGTDLVKDKLTDYPRPDITLFLSMNYHIPIPERIFESELVVFEDNGKESRNKENLGKPWTDYFGNIKFVGRAKDHGDKPIYHLS